MKRFIIQLIIFLAIPVFSGILIYLLRPHNNQIYFNTLNEKIRLLDSVPSPRIILIGGSNVFLGFDSQRMSDSLGIPVINTGTNMHYGMKYHIEFVEKRLKPNDILLIQPEIEQFFGGTMNGTNTDRLAIAMISTSFHDFNLLNIEQLRITATGFPSAIYRYYDPKTKKNSKDLMNNYGDETAHWSDSTMFRLYPGTVEMDTETDKQAIKYLSNKIKEFKKNGLQVIFMPPVMINSYYRTKRLQLMRVAKDMSEVGASFDVPYDSHVMPDSFRYDSPVHLNKTGVDSLTTLVIRQIKAIGITTKST